MSLRNIFILFTVIGSSYSGRDVCLMPPPLKGSERVYRTEAEHISGIMGKRRMLLGLFPIHKDDCTTVLSTKNYNGFQRAEAMAFAINLVNEEVRLNRRRVPIDGYILDSCSNGVSAIDATLQAMSKAAPVAGMVGASYSGVSLAVSPVLQAYKVSTLSYASTAIGLSNKKEFPLFGRLVPSDVGQARVVYDLAVSLGWTTVELLTVAHSDYSKSLRDEFSRIVEEEGDKIFICEDSDNELKYQDRERTHEVIKKLMVSKSDGVIVFVHADAKRDIVRTIGDVIRERAQPLLASADSLKMRMVSTDSWDVTDLEDEAAARFLHRHSYVVIPDASGQSRMHRGRNITHHFEQLSPATSNNTWITEVWKDIFGCDADSDPICRRRTLNLSEFQIDSKVDFVVDSVLLFSEALDRLDQDSLMGRITPVNSFDFFWNYILKSEYNDDGRQVKLDCNGDRVGYYGVYRYDYTSHRYLKIGYWSGQEEEGKELRLFNEMEVRFGGVNATKWDNETCRPSCMPGYYEDFHDKNSKCCYTCEKLDRRSYRQDFGNPQDCPDGQWPDAVNNYSNCVMLEVEKLESGDAWSVFALFFAWVGIILGLAFLAFSIKHYDHVVMRNSSRELSTLTWGGVMICHLNTIIVFYSFPSDSMCSLIRFTMTTGYTLILSSLYLKTNRLFRIFYAQFKQTSGVLGKLRYTSPKYQVLFCLGLVLFQCFIVMLWLLTDSATPISVFPAARHVVLCQLNALHLLYAQSFNIVLCIVTTAYSFLTRRVPANFNESRFINLSMYSVCVAWVVEAIGWIFREDLSDKEAALLYNPERSWAISTLSKSIMATLVLVFMFSHRVYKILIDRTKTDGEEEEAPQIIRMEDKKSSSTAGGGAELEEPN